MGWSKRGRIAALLAVGLAAAFLVLPQAALADDGQLGGIAGNFYPLSNNHIRMQSETVQAICYRGFAEYQVDFLFVNSGPAERVTLGFPFAVDTEDSSAHPLAFRAWQDGKPLAVTLGSGKIDPYTDYYVHTATFPRGKTMIRVSYLARESAGLTSSTRFPELKPSQFALPGIDDSIQASYDYWLHTGSGWAGTIGIAVVRYTLADDFRGYALDETSAPQSEYGDEYAVTQPASYFKPDDRTFEWVFKNLEPTEKDDIELGFTKLSGGDEGAVMGAEVADVTSSTPDPDGTPGWTVSDGDPSSALTMAEEHPWIQMAIEGNEQIREMRIVTGDNTTVRSFRESSRPKTVKVTLSDGTASIIKLADEPSVQKFPITGKADWVRLDVLDSYPGSKSAAICISEVSFGNQPAPSFQAFESLIKASASVVTTSTVPVPTSSTSSTSSTDTPETDWTGAFVQEPESTTSLPVTTTTTTTTAPPTTVSTVPAVDPAKATATQRSTAWTTWPIVLLCVAAAALVTAATLTGILFSRRKGGR